MSWTTSPKWDRFVNSYRAECDPLFTSPYEVTDIEKGCLNNYDLPTFEQLQKIQKPSGDYVGEIESSANRIMYTSCSVSDVGQFSPVTLAS